MDVHTNIYTKAEVDALLGSKSTVGHTHDDRYYTESEIDGFLAGKSAVGHTHDDRYFTEAEITTLLAGKSDTGHTHDDRYYTETEIDSLLTGKANASHTHTISQITDAGTAAGFNVPSVGNAAVGEVVIGSDARLTDARTPTAHTHDERYYTESEIDAFLTGKSDTGHTHDGRYYTETEIDSLLSGKANTSHTHTLSQVTDAGTAASKNVPASGDASSTEVVLGSDSRLGGVSVPIGGIIFYDSGVSGASYPSGNFIKCEGGAIPGGGTAPDLRDKFLRGKATPGGSSSTTTHQHTISTTAVNVAPCGGGGEVTINNPAANPSTSANGNLPPYHDLITLLRYA